MSKPSTATSSAAASAAAAETTATPPKAPRRKTTRTATVPAARTKPTTSDSQAATTTAAQGGAAPLRSMSEVRHFLRMNTVPVFFVGATPFNLLGLDRFVRNFSYITYYDAWDGAHPRVFTPRHKPYIEFQSGEEINNWLLVNPEVRAHIAAATAPGVRPKIAMVFFNEQTESICAELGYDVILPPAALRDRLDSKLVTTRLAAEVGVASVPNTLTTVADYTELLAAAEAAGLGADLVVQTAYGDSGKTTFFIDEEADWKQHAHQISGVEVKVMKRIDAQPVAVEAVITRRGTVVGPFMSELTGHPELTPYRGGWCGNETFPGVLEGEVRERAADMVSKLGDRLGQEGYRGFFEVDVLVDRATGDPYLGELNPRISGATSITNVTAGAYADVPLFAFHLLEHLDVELELDIAEINERWRRLAADDLWSQMVIKETSPAVELITTAPRTGLYSIDAAGSLVHRDDAWDWHPLQDENEVYFLRISGVGEYRWKGADLGVVLTKGRLQRQASDGSEKLTIRAKHLVDAVRQQYAGVPLAAVGVTEGA
ncbi:Biotin carboxylase [Quadrisphaera granulorum]|uniref:Biotin carboxylase n=1 Tax=Quadrisphaera granulorum TaxID=317664 RepID=A0A316AC79_9ACTN|nr:biotin carboxylase [Quadrisphaera granulorum]PWJ54878.1 biotin carboxylase [Quadrisphaera granulorum]SZE95824.1 Biotin carboxylase [Quadrisphaera granulorum]